MKGKITFDYVVHEGRPEQMLTVGLQQAPANRDYRLMVDFGEGEMQLKIFHTDAVGEAALAFGNPCEQLSNVHDNCLPAGQDVRNIRRVRVLLEDQAVMEARF